MTAFSLDKTTYSPTDYITISASGAFVNIPSESNISIIDYSDSTAIPIDYSIISSELSGTVIIKPNTSLTHNKIYNVCLYNIALSGDGFINFDVVRFICSDSTYTRNKNDIAYKLNNINDLLSIESVLKSKIKNDYTVSPTYYDGDQEKYLQHSTELVANNTEILLEQLINQYYQEYGTMFYNLDNRDNIKTEHAKTYLDDYINDLKLFIMKNITKLNSLKGSKYLIEFVIGIYTRILGYNLISVVEDNTHNFVYRVSASLPKAFWFTHIKPIVHPAGWSDIYSVITSDTSITSFDNNSLLKQIRQNWNRDCISYLDADFYSKVYLKKYWYQQFKRIYHTHGNIELENVINHGASGHKNNCTFQSKLDHVQFNLNYACSDTSDAYDADRYLINVNPSDFYIISNSVTAHNIPIKNSIVKADTLDREIRDKHNIQATFDYANNIATLTYQSTGIATIYEWRRLNGTTLVESVTTFHNQYTFTLDSNSIYHQVVLILHKNNWEQTPVIYEQLAYIKSKTVRETWANVHQYRKFNNVRVNQGNRSCSYDMLSIRSFDSEAVLSSIATTNDLNYTYLSQASSADFIAEVDDQLLFDVSTSTYISNNTNATKVVVSYNKYGIASEYKWYVYISGNLNRTCTTYMPEFTFNANSSIINNIEIKLELILRDSSYLLTNTIVL